MDVLIRAALPPFTHPLSNRTLFPNSGPSSFFLGRNQIFFYGLCKECLFVLQFPPSDDTDIKRKMQFHIIRTCVCTWENTEESHFLQSTNHPPNLLSVNKMKLICSSSFLIYPNVTVIGGLVSPDVHMARALASCCPIIMMTK